VTIATPSVNRADGAICVVSVLKLGIGPECRKPIFTPPYAANCQILSQIPV
jgi:hypothetical protein